MANLYELVSLYTISVSKWWGEKKKKREREGYDLGVNVKEGFCLCGELVQRRGCNVFYGNGESATGLVLRVESWKTMRICWVISTLFLSGWVVSSSVLLPPILSLSWVAPYTWTSSDTPTKVGHARFSLSTKINYTNYMLINHIYTILIYEKLYQN